VQVEVEDRLPGGATIRHAPEGTGAWVVCHADCPSLGQVCWVGAGVSSERSRAMKAALAAV
jgi:hypothetical protein